LHPEQSGLTSRRQLSTDPDEQGLSSSCQLSTYPNERVTSISKNIFNILMDTNDILYLKILIFSIYIM
jgi:hypothetical protein